MGNFVADGERIFDTGFSVDANREWRKLYSKHRCNYSGAGKIREDFRGFDFERAVCEETSLIGKLSQAVRKDTRRSRVDLYSLRCARGLDLYTGAPLAGNEFTEWLLVTGLASSCPLTNDWLEMAIWLSCFPTLWASFKEATEKPHVMLLSLWSNGLVVTKTSSPAWVQMENVPSWLWDSARAQYRYVLRRLGI